MAQCKLHDICVFFKDHLKNKPSIAEMYKHKYCDTDFDQCARFLIKEALGTAAVPNDLYPNEVHKIKEIISAAMQVRPARFHIPLSAGQR